MIDQELLEAAAKAAGVGWRWFGATFCIDKDAEMGTFQPWNPLTDDGDAFQLAVKLRMTIHRHDPSAVCAGWGVGTDGAPTLDGKGPWFWKEWLRDQQDDATATRRAIVQAAAKIVSATLPRHSEQMSDK